MSEVNMNCSEKTSNFNLSLLSLVDRPINILDDNLSGQTKINSRFTFDDFKRHYLSERYCYYSAKQFHARKVQEIIKKSAFIILISCVLSLSGTFLVIDFSKINPTWYILIICELTLCPSLAVLIWKIRYQKLANKNELLQNMFSISLDLAPDEIIHSKEGFEEKYKKFLDDSSIESVKQNEYLKLLHDTRNIRIFFSKLTFKQDKILGPLSDNLAVEIILFVATFAVSAITFILDLMKNESTSANLIISDYLALSLALALGLAIGIFLSNRSLKKALEISIFRYLFYSFVTNSK